MRANKYILDGKTAKPEGDLLAWGRWMETADRIVAKTQVGNMRVSTVFLGLDHALMVGPPLLFETMIFGGHGEINGYQERCSTWDQAETQHAKAVDTARAALA